jgi:hypothetical protein
MPRGGRKDGRISFERPFDALMMGIDGTWRRECHLFDVSVSAAKLIVTGSVKGLTFKQFFLLLTQTGTISRRCELVRVNGDEIGVRFLTKSDVRKPTRWPASAPAAVE